MSTERPLIGICRSATASAGELVWHRLALGVAGARTVSITPVTPEPAEPVGGLVLTGGTDVFPPRYGGAPKPGYRYDPARDDMEAAWLDRAETDDLPVLAICRGVQLLNVNRGGSLHGDVRDHHGAEHYPGAGIGPALTFRKWIEVDPQSRLATITRSTRLYVNALNTQAIEQLGQGLAISAREANGVVQGLEDTSRRFLIGVQFHPEFLTYKPVIRRLFAAFVKAAGGRR